MSRLLEETVLPPDNAEALAAIEVFLDDNLLLELSAQDGSQIKLPDELRSLLVSVVSSMRRGQAITLAPHAMRLTTQQAADLLGVSRPTLV